MGEMDPRTRWQAILELSVLAGIHRPVRSNRTPRLSRAQAVSKGNGDISEICSAGNGYSDGDSSEDQHDRKSWNIDGGAAGAYGCRVNSRVWAAGQSMQVVRS